MMSRAHRSDTWNTPSIIDSESASIRLRSWASWRISSSSVRDSGSGEMKSVRRSSSERFSCGLSVSLRLGYESFMVVRPGHAGARGHGVGKDTPRAWRGRVTPPSGRGHAARSGPARERPRAARRCPSGPSYLRKARRGSGGKKAARNGARPAPSGI
ncbi:hypothetical protein BLAT2472_60098 [Burkholderia latens]